MNIATSETKGRTSNELRVLLTNTAHGCFTTDNMFMLAVLNDTLSLNKRHFLRKC